MILPRDACATRMHSAVYATSRCLSVCLSVCRFSIKTTKQIKLVFYTKATKAKCSAYPRRCLREFAYLQKIRLLFPGILSQSPIT